ncbi:MAG: OmpA family protein [Bdellovibrionales bacterium]|nr:OmpA family protein [Bdellovibrionales bacterium]
MEDVVQARQAAINAGAPRYFKTDFNDVDKNLAEVISSVEANKLDSLTKNRAKLQAAYLEVELKAIKETNLGPARATLGLATKEGAQDHAPQSLASTEKKIADADAFIVANRHDTAGIQAISKIALDSANHLVRINREAKEGKNITAEESALRVEREQAKTAEEANRLKTANSQLDAAAQAAAATATANARLEAEAAALKSEQAFNQKLEAARAEFTESEAEVYRQGNRLVIRLHSLEFPRNKAVLRSTNMPIMAKVEKVVKEFNNPTVIVEGHTDSDGGKALNQKLSTQRSELISSYLVSSKAVDTSHISSKGYGYDRPIASNKTPEGKAQNRRVDVIITPTTEPAIQAR